MDNLEQKVKRANRDFYNIVGASYEKIDGRRNNQLKQYIASQLQFVFQNTESNSILDLGCGTGFISHIAQNYFKQRYALDISLGVLIGINDKSILKIVADFDAIPIRDGKLNGVIAFSVLHHCYSFEKMFAEIYRILKKDGIFYSDHDIDSLFFERFKPLVKLYRRINNAKKRYLSKFADLSEDMYNYSEFYKEGIPSDRIGKMLQKIGFKKVLIQYHWYGLSLFLSKIFGQRRYYKRGYAPLVRIIAIK